MADSKTPPAQTPEAKVSFRIFAHGLDLPTAAALRVSLGLLPKDVDREFTAQDLQAALDKLNAPPAKKEA